MAESNASGIKELIGKVKEDLMEAYDPESLFFAIRHYKDLKATQAMTTNHLD